jgi:hypothetical protein
MVLDGHSEKDIEELDEIERSSHLHESGVYVSYLLFWILPANHLTFIFSHTIGRGGYANITLGELPYTEGAVNLRGANHPHATHGHLVETYGRGSAGNMTCSRPGSKFPSRSPEPVVHASGRGGVGNMMLGGPSEKHIKELPESERSSNIHDLGVYVFTSFLTLI